MSAEREGLRERFEFAALDEIRECFPMEDEDAHEACAGLVAHRILALLPQAQEPVAKLTAEAGRHGEVFIRCEAVFLETGLEPGESMYVYASPVAAGGQEPVGYVVVGEDGSVLSRWILTWAGSRYAVDDGPLGDAFQAEIAAKVLLGEVPRESIDCEGLGQHMRSLAHRLRAPTKEQDDG